jgi:hypothetical protein
MRTKRIAIPKRAGRTERPPHLSAAAGDDVAQESTAQPIGKIYNRDVYGN